MKFRETKAEIQVVKNQVQQILELLKKNPESVNNVDIWQEIALPPYLEHIWKVEKTIVRLEMRIDTCCPKTMMGHTFFQEYLLNNNIDETTLRKQYCREAYSFGKHCEDL